MDEINRLLHQNEQTANTFLSFGQFLDVVPVRASKGFALRWCADQWDIPLENILVAGGSGADEDMMRGNTMAVVVANRHHEELSGLEPTDEEWTRREDLADTLRALLGEVGRVYTPFLLANARAIEAGAEKVETMIDGLPWTQKPFPYQAKCLRWLRERRDGLSPADRAWVDEVLAGTGCEALFA